MQKIKSILAAAAVTLSLFAQSTEDRAVNRVSFLGNDTFSHRTLISQIELKPPSLLVFSRVDFDRRLLKLDAISLKNYYHSKGFLEATVKDSFVIADNEVDIFFILQEGKQYFLNKVTVNGLISFKEKKVLSLLGLKKGAYYNPVQINTNLTLVDEAFRKKVNYSRNTIFIRILRIQSTLP